jgi:hypothetical protein
VRQTGGQVVCSTATATFNLSQPFAFDYVGDSLEQASAAEGDVPSAFLQQIPQSSCVAGRYVGEVNVLVVVDVGYDIQFNASAFLETAQQTATSGFPAQSFTPEDGHLTPTTAGKPIPLQPTGARPSTVRKTNSINSIFNKPRRWRHRQHHRVDYRPGWSRWP